MTRLIGLQLSPDLTGLAAPRGDRRIDLKQAIESQIFQRAAIALPDSGDLDAALRSELRQSGRETRELPHERRVHAGAGFEVDDKTSLSRGDAGFGALLHDRTDDEGTFSLAANPSEPVEYSDQNGVFRTHV